MNLQKDYIQLIYRLLVGLLGIGFLYVIWPYISSVLLMLVFAFLFTTVLLPSVDALERKIRNRGLSVLAVTIGLITAISIFIGSFATNLADQAGGTLPRGLRATNATRHLLKQQEPFQANPIQASPTGETHNY